MVFSTELCNYLYLILEHFYCPQRNPVSISPGIFLTQGLNLCLLCLLHCRWTLYLLSHTGVGFLISKVGQKIYCTTQVICED